MSEQGSGTHGPVRDDAIKSQDEAEARDYVEEWPEPETEPDDETERQATWAPGARLADSPTPEDWEAVELRSDLARRLDRTVWPATRERLLENPDRAQRRGQAARAGDLAPGGAALREPARADPGARPGARRARLGRDVD